MQRAAEPIVVNLRLDNMIYSSCRPANITITKALLATFARLDRKCGDWFDLSMEHPGYLLRDTKIPIIRQFPAIGIEREPIAGLGSFISWRHCLEDGGAFVHFVEH